MRDNNGRFVKGFSGNPSGIRKDAHSSVTEADKDANRPQIVPVVHGDGWSSVLLGIGTRGSDKREHSHFHAKLMSYEEAIELWRGDDLAARAIEAVPADCFREGYEITISDEGSYDDLKEDIEERLIELKVDEIIERAYKYERAFGGAAILVGVDDGRTLDEPLDPAKVKAIKHLTLMEPLEIYPASYYQDPESAKYGEPEFYRLQAFTISGAGTVIGVTDKRAPTPETHLIHESRLIVFGGIRVSRYQRNVGLMGPLWGDSMLIRLVDVLRDFNIAWAAAGIIATDFAQTVISIENLMQLVARDPDKVIARLKAMEMMRSNARAAVIDSKEKLTRESTNTQGLPELLDRLSQRLAAAIDMPLSLLLGTLAGGLGTDTAQDVRIYYDRVRSVQRRRIQPVLRFIISMIMQTLRKRKVPKKWDIRWNELWRLTDAERAEARLTQARSDSMYVKMGSVTSDEIRTSRFVGGYSFETQVNEDEDAPGFVSPPPPGTPGSPNNPPAGAGNTVNNQPAAQKGKSAGPNVHGVRGYARKNPTPKGPGVHAKQGGDVAPENKRDSDGGGISKTFAGLPVTIETPKGSTRFWTDTDGSQGQTKMRYDYGYVQGASGADGDSVDVYLGPTEDAQDVYIIHQNRKPDFVVYDEDKVMLGFDSVNHARDAYLAHYNDDRFFGSMTVMSLADFKSNYLGSSVTARVEPDPDHVDEEINLDRIVKEGSDYVVKNEAGTKVLARKKTKAEAVKRLREIEYFKNHPDEDGSDMDNEDEITGGFEEQEELEYALDKPKKRKKVKNELANSALQLGNDPDSEA